MYPFLAIDFETADPGRDSACAIGLARVEGAEVVRREARLIRPPRPAVHPACRAVHGLTWDDLKGAGPFAAVVGELKPLFAGVAHLVAHNAAFDRSVLEACCRAVNWIPPKVTWVCTLALARRRWPGPHDLKATCERLGVPLNGHHHAGADAEAAARCLIALEGRRGNTTERDRVIAEVFARAGAAGKCVYGYCTRSASGRPLTKPDEVPPEFDRLCVDGDGCWLPLPLISPEPDSDL